MVFFKEKEHFRHMIHNPGLLQLMEHSGTFIDNHTACIIDLEPTTERIESYWKQEGIVIIGTIHTSLRYWASIFGKPIAKVVGINQIPFYLNKQAIECTSLDHSYRPMVTDFLATYGIDILWSQDTPGMVAARVTAMIINEACFLIGEGISDENDLNIAMKLGVNYPDGPMEWLQKIGAVTIADILSALYTYYQSDKYRLAPYLHRLYLHQKMEHPN